MLIKSIDILGFKSFADKTTLKFGHGLTAVVGPNGSGKSNVSDAVRWVLGEQSTKNLRGNSMEDVIFNGTSTRKPHGYCEVTIYFDNRDRSLNYNEDEVSVTRRYYRSHESEYRINGNTVRLRDINELFMDTGLGRDGYSMIGQGKVDAIVSSKSNERRDIFEEASGISRYRYRKIDAERRLHAADENLLRLNDIMQELKSRVGPLKEQSAKAERFLALAAVKKDLEIGLWLKTLAESKEAFRNQESKIAIATGQYAEIERQLADYDQTTLQNSAEFAKATADIDRTRDEIAALEEELVRTDGQMEVIKTNIAHHRQNIERLNNEKTELLQSSGSNAELLAAKNATIAALEQKLALLQSKIEKQSAELTGLISGSESVSRKMEELALQLNVVSDAASKLKVQSVTAETSAAELQSRSQSLQKTLGQKQQEKQRLSAEMAELEKDRTRCEEQLSSEQNTLTGYELRLNSRKNAADAEKQELDRLTLDIGEQQRRAKILEDLQHSMEGYQYSVKACMAQAEKGLLHGVYGPVSTLIRVPGEYAVAVEVALGAAAQNIVVQSEADAKQAIRFLKTNNKGRATFLPVGTIRARALEEKINTGQYGFVGIASELINYDEKISPIMQWLLGRTVIAEDLDSAAVIAKKYGYRFKVVTLDGQVLNPGGSLTGGSLAKNSGLLSRQNEIERLKKSAEKLVQTLKQKQTLFEQTKQALAACEADVLAARAAVTTASEDKIRVLGEIRRVSQLLAAAQVELAAIEKEQQTAGERLLTYQNTQTNCTAELKRLAEQEGQLKAEMEQVSNGRDETAAKRETLTEQLTALRLEQAGLQKDIAVERSAVAGLEESAQSRGEKAAQIESEAAALAQTVAGLEQATQAAEAQKQKISAEILQKRQQSEQLLQQRTEIEAASTRLRQQEKDKTLQREKINGELERLRAKKDAMQEEFDGIIKRLYDEYELTRTEAENMNIVIENAFEAKKQLAETKSKIKALGSVNVAAIEEYKEVGERYEFMLAQMQDVEKTRKELGTLIGDLTEQMKTQFLQGFKQIGENFSHIFVEMFGGGSAHLKLTDEADPLQSGIEIIAKLPGKNVPSLEGLSGGEKALIAISIYFAIMQVNAPPFCFLDEVETALDDINVERFANYMKSSKLDTQFICITHRRGTMEAADMLYGVTMQEKGVTRLIELNVKQLELDLKGLEKQG